LHRPDRCCPIGTGKKSRIPSVFIGCHPTTLLFALYSGQGVCRGLSVCYLLLCQGTFVIIRRLSESCFPPEGGRQEDRSSEPILQNVERKPVTPPSWMEPARASSSQPSTPPRSQSSGKWQGYRDKRVFCFLRHGGFVAYLEKKEKSKKKVS